jgi:glycosyltransferase involved in cell wall biosynthesis
MSLNLQGTEEAFESDFKKLPKIDVFLVSKFHNNFPFLGISKSTLELTEVFENLNLTVCLITESEYFHVVEVKRNLILVGIPRSPKLFKAMWSLKLPHPIAAWIVNVLEYVKISGIVVVPIVGLQSVLCKHLSPSVVKRIITLHTPYSKATVMQSLFHKIQKDSLAHGDFIVANSRTIIEKFELSSFSNVGVIPHFVARNLISRNSNEFENERPSFIWIGSLNYRKGVDRLIKLILLNRGRNPLEVVWTSTRFSFIYEYCLQGLSRLGFVRLHTRLSEDELVSLVGNASGLISTSRFESFGMTIVEAGLQGKGLVALSAPGVTETLPNKEAGARFYSKLTELNSFLVTSSESELVKMGKDSQIYCEANYGLEEISGKWKKLFLTLN